MRSQIKEMDEELQRTIKNSEDLKLTINDRNLHAEALKSEVNKLKAQIMEKEKLIRLFVEDLHKIYTDLDPSEYKNGLVQLYVFSSFHYFLLTFDRYQTYVTGDSKRRITREDQERMQGNYPPHFLFLF